MARSAASSITEIRYCIFGHLLCFGAPLAGGRSPLLRTALTRSDTASRNSFQDFRSPATANTAGGQTGVAAIACGAARSAPAGTARFDYRLAVATTSVRSFGFGIVT